MLCDGHAERLEMVGRRTPTRMFAHRCVEPDARAMPGGWKWLCAGLPYACLRPRA